MADLRGPIIPDKRVKFRDPRLNLPEKFNQKPFNQNAECSIFGRFLNFDNCRPEVAGDAISGAAFDYVGVDVLAKCG